MEKNKTITVSAEASPLLCEIKLRRLHFSLVVPDREFPCSAYIYFKGKYIEVIKRGAIAPLTLIAKMYKSNNFFFYVLENEYHLFEYWIKERHSFESLPHFNLNDDKKKFEFKIAKYQRNAVESLTFSDDNITSRRLMKDAETKLRKVISHADFRWYFEREWDSGIMEHTSRVTYSMLLFLEMNTEVWSQVDPYDLISASILHELTGNPKDFSSLETYKQSLDFLQENKLTIREEVIKIIANQNELYNGEGKPRGLQGDKIPFTNQILSVFDYFDHHRMTVKNLTKGKALGQLKVQLEPKAEFFNPSLFKAFLNFLELVKF